MGNSIAACSTHLLIELVYNHTLQLKQILLPDSVDLVDKINSICDIKSIIKYSRFSNVNQNQSISNQNKQSKIATSGSVMIYVMQ